MDLRLLCFSFRIWYTFGQRQPTHPPWEATLLLALEEKPHHLSRYMSPMETE